MSTLDDEPPIAQRPQPRPLCIAAARRGRRDSVARLLLASRAMSQHRVSLGKTGEDLACRELERRGYAIVARRYRERGGELDIIARDGTTMVFVEVKAREGRAFGAAPEAVTALKRRTISNLALHYLMRHRLTDCPCRFDVVSIQFTAGQPAIEVFQNAFDARTT